MREREKKKKHSKTFLRERIVFSSNVRGGKPRSTGYVSASLSRFLFLSSTDLRLIEADNGQERHGEKQL